jgi:hypothetical protein
VLDQSIERGLVRLTIITRWALGPSLAMAGATGCSGVLARAVSNSTPNRTFEAHDLSTAAQAAHERARVRDSKASSTVDRVSQWNAADALFSGKFEELLHHRFSLPSLGLAFLRLVLRSGRHILLLSVGGFGKWDTHDLVG